MKNRYEIHGDCVVVFAFYKSKELTFTVDLTELNKVKAIVGSWHTLQIKSQPGKFYIVGRLSGSREKVYLHRYLIDAPLGYSVDHQDGDRTNNRLSNLKIVDHATNMENRTYLPINNKTGARGVSWDSGRGKWKANVKVRGKAHTRRFTAFEEADNWAKELRRTMLPNSNEAREAT